MELGHIEELLGWVLLGIVGLQIGCISGDYREETHPPSEQEYRVVRIGEGYSLADINPQSKWWDTAEVLTDFRFPWIDGAPPSTIFRAWHNESHVFFHFEVEDADVVVVKREMNARDVIFSDRVELFFACDDSLMQYYGVEMDPEARVYDYSARFYREFDPEWTWEELEVQSVLTESGYNVWGTIPIKDLKRLNVWRKGNRIRAGIYRAEFSYLEQEEIEQTWISWIDPRTPVPDFHVPGSFAWLVLE